MEECKCTDFCNWNCNVVYKCKSKVMRDYTELDDKNKEITNDTKENRRTDDSK